MLGPLTQYSLFGFQASLSLSLPLFFFPTITFGLSVHVTLFA